MRSALLPRRGEGGGRGDGLKARVGSGFHHRCICYPHKVPPRKRIGGALWGCTALVMAHERQGVGWDPSMPKKRAACQQLYRWRAVRSASMQCGVGRNPRGVGGSRPAPASRYTGEPRPAPHAARAVCCTRASIALTMPWTHFAAVCEVQGVRVKLGG